MKTHLPGIKLFKYQEIAVQKLRTGSILCGGVGSGKTRTALAYYYIKEKPKDLFVITTAAKRDTLDWEREAAMFIISKDRTISIDNIKFTIDSWNNIKKYINIKNAFFIFDEQRVIGSGVWVKSFLKITKENNWILLSATPGDTWIDYIPVFLGNGFYKNRTEFLRTHVVYNSFTKFPKINHYIGIKKLEKLRSQILVTMNYIKPTESIFIDLYSNFDKDKLNAVIKDRWNPYTDSPITNRSDFLFTMRKVINSDMSRLEIVLELIEKHRKIIAFYNFNYELDILRLASGNPKINVREYNGHKHEVIPEGDRWLYLVQYLSGAEGWNCIESNTVIFYSLNYSHRIMTQAAGRIDRLNTTFSKLYYYRILSNSIIDKEIQKALKNKKDFNESVFIKEKFYSLYKNLRF